MTEVMFTCPRCFYSAPLRSDLRFCPRCGLSGLLEAAMDTSPLDIVVGARRFAVLDRIGIGSIATVYRCRFHAGRKEVEGVFKVARDARTNDRIANEADILRRLNAADHEARFTPFLPAVEETTSVRDDPAVAPRQANIFRMHEKIASPDELYTLAEVRGAYRAGLPPRDMAWIWRRILTVLGFVHAQRIVHTAVLPPHILIEPREHKLVLIDWCGALHDAQRMRLGVTILSGGHRPWYPPEVRSGSPPSGALDISLAARSMIELIGGEPISGRAPATLEPALDRYFQRCIGSAFDAPIDAWKLLDDFDRLIEKLWGKRTFRALEMPAKMKH